MNQQLNIFAAPPSHAIDPGTSRVAAQRAAKGAGAHRDRILLWLARRGEHGGTAFEAWQETGGARPSGAGTRLGELAKPKHGPPLVRQHHDRTRPTDTGSPAAIWTITEAGRRYVKESILKGAA